MKLPGVEAPVFANKNAVSGVILLRRVQAVDDRVVKIGDTTSRNAVFDHLNVMGVFCL